MQHGGYDLIVIEDFYDCFINLLKELETYPKSHEESKVDTTYEEFVHK